MPCMGIISNLVSSDEMYHSIHHPDSSELRNAIVVQDHAAAMGYNVLQKMPEWYNTVLLKFATMC